MGITSIRELGVHLLCGEVSVSGRLRTLFGNV